MSTLSVNDFGYILGRSSVFALLAGLSCSLYGMIERDRAKSLLLASGMGVLAFFLGTFVLAHSYGYSGPLSSAERELPRYSIHFALLISFAFGFGFALDALFVKDIRWRALAAFLAVLYSLGAWSVITGCLDQKP